MRVFLLSRGMSDFTPIHCETIDATAQARLDGAIRTVIEGNDDDMISFNRISKQYGRQVLFAEV